MTEDVMELADDVQEKVIQQYEDIRTSGTTNMFDYLTVKSIADAFFFTELYLFIRDSRKAYTSILTNFSKLMTKFDIQQA